MAQLTYADIDPPNIGDGSLRNIATGVEWMRLPVPGNLGCINVWPLADDGGWTIVDTGLRLKETATAWKAAIEGPLSSAEIRRVCVTHMHPDHSGMAGWLAKHYGAQLWMSPEEYWMLRALVAGTGGEIPDNVIQFYRAAGWQEDQLDSYRSRASGMDRMVYPLPFAFVRMRDGDMIETDAGRWEIITGRGHSAEQSLLYNAQMDMLISGDQVLPRISSNVSVYAQEPHANPLALWLESLAEVKARVPDSALVLPSHGQPFHGLHARIDDLIAEHEDAMGRMCDLLKKPHRAVDLFDTLFRRDIDQSNLMMATGESLAHLHCMQARGQVEVSRDADGVDWWSLAS